MVLMVNAIVTKTGNSYALRVPKSYITNSGLKLGDVVKIDEPIEKQKKMLDELVRMAESKKLVSSIPDPSEWQREQRREWKDPWEEVKNDTTR